MTSSRFDRLKANVRQYQTKRQIENHFKKYKKVYIPVSAAVVGAGITFLIMRGKVNSSGMTGTASSGVTGTGDNNLSSFSPKINIVGNRNFVNLQPVVMSNRQGAPSWVVRCLETGETFASQRSAAIANDIPESILSKCLNGLISDAHGLHFERICLAA